MAQPGLIYDVDDKEIQERVQEIAARMEDLTPIMDLVGEIGVASIQKNFDEYGRPEPWRELKTTTIERRKVSGSWPGQILVVRGALKKISYEAEAKKVTLMPANVPYAAAQHFGVDKQITQSIGKHYRVITQAFGKELDSPKRVEVKGHQRSMHMNIPARQYMLLQTEDGVEIMAVLGDWLLDNDEQRGA